MTRPAVTRVGLNYYSGYLSDTFTAGDLTVNAGVRYDVQSGNNLASTVPANPVAPDVLPGIRRSTGRSPSRGRTSSRASARPTPSGRTSKTLVKASYSQYADQLGSGTISFINPGQLSGVYYGWNDANGDHVITRDEVDFSTRFGFYGFDPDNPGSAISPNIIDPDLKAGKTSEITAGIEREIIPDFVVGVGYTYRKYDNALWPHRTGLTRDDYEVGGQLEGTLFDGSSFSQPFYQLRPGVEIPNGVTMSNRPDWNTTYNGVDLTFQKRLTNRWMVRGSFTYADWKQSGDLNSCYDPTSDRGGNALVWPGTAVPIPAGSTCAGDDIAAARGRRRRAARGPKCSSTRAGSSTSAASTSSRSVSRRGELLRA